jgi:hypothetical protein
VSIVKKHHVTRQIKELNIHIGLTSPNGKSYKDRQGKHQQLADYYTVVKSIVRKLSTKRTLYLYDCACGRAYLSFYLNYRLRKDGFANIEFICIDQNEALIERCKQIATELSMDNMRFCASSIRDFKFAHQPDIIYSLHACNDASDQMIYKGIVNEARHILSVSCCQHEVRSHMKSHSLRTFMRHRPYKERLADMVSDSLRALILEAYGYKVHVFEFTAGAHTAKNIMLRSNKIHITEHKKEQALVEYEELSSLFKVQSFYMLTCRNMTLLQTHA